MCFLTTAVCLSSRPIRSRVSFNFTDFSSKPTILCKAFFTLKGLGWESFALLEKASLSCATTVVFSCTILAAWSNESKTTTSPIPYNLRSSSKQACTGPLRTDQQWQPTVTGSLVLDQSITAAVTALRRVCGEVIRRKPSGLRQKL